MDIENSQHKTLIKAGIITSVSFVLGFLFNYFFYSRVPGVNFFLYVLLIVVGLFVIASFLKKQIDKKIIWLFLPLVFFSAMVFVRSSLFLTFLNIVASLLLLLIIAEVSFGNRIKNFLIGDYVKIFFLPFKFIRSLLKTLSDLLSLGRANKDQKVFSRVLKGILMAVPVLFVFIVLFSSADLIFKKYLSDLISLNIDPETIVRFVIILITTLVFMGAYSYIFGEKQNQITGEQNDGNHSIGDIESSILLASVNVLFFIFIIVQLTYLFGGESNISAQGFTYAEYARRGFFELIAVAVISLFLLLITEKSLTRNETKHRLGFKILSTILVVEVILIMTSAFARLSLYEQAYGFTTLRLFSHAFIVFLVAVFCLLLYKIYKDKRENAFAFRVFILTILFLAFLNFLNPDAFIARQNIERFRSSGKLDAYYLGRLSSDALPETIKILDITNKELREQFALQLYWQSQDLTSTYFSNWKSFNISRMHAKKILNSKMQELEKYNDFERLPFN